MSIRRNFVLFATSFTLALFPFCIVCAQTTITTDIQTDTTWTVTGSPYVITTAVAVDPYTTLTIEPGVVIKFMQGTSLGVFGVLNAVGTTSSPILFTSFTDDVAGDTNEDGDVSLPSPGDWDGIVFLGDTFQTISNISLRYAGSGFDFQNTGNTLDHISCIYTKRCFSFTGAQADLDTITVDYPTGEILSLLGGSHVTLSNTTFNNLESVTDSDLISVFLDSSLVINTLNASAVPAIDEGMTTFLNSSLQLSDSVITKFNTTRDALSAFSNASLSLSNTKIIGSGTGDGVQVFSTSKFTLSNGMITNFGGSGIATFNASEDPPNELTISDSIISYNDTGIFATADPLISTDTVSIHDNQTAGVTHYGSSPLSISNTWWGDVNGPHNDVTNPSGHGNGVSDDVLFVPYLTEDPFHEVVVPATYYAKITGLTQGFANMRDAPSADATLLKTLPIDYVVYIISKTDDVGHEVIADGYHWYKVEDPNDTTVGWMVVSLENINDPTYLPYKENEQQNYIDTAVTRYDGNANLAARREIILEAVDHYLNNTDTTKSLYSSDDSIKISDLAAGLPKELILAIIAQESGGAKFDNEIVSPDYGHGEMQITPNYHSNEKEKTYIENSSEALGKYSKSKNSICSGDKNDNYKKCYQNTNNFNESKKPYDFYDHNPLNPKYKEYANTKQSIYANIKDGLSILTSKYNLGITSACKQDIYTIEGETFSCKDLHVIKTVWAYNGMPRYIPDPDLKNNHYMKVVSQQLASISTYFPGYTYNNSDHLIEKLAIADRHRKEIKVHSPVDLRVIDTNTNEATGVTNGEIVEEIDNSVYDPDTEGVLVLFPEDNYQYSLIGTADSNYGFDVDRTDTSGELQTIFTASDIPVEVGAIHTITLDETVLAQGGDGATLTIDHDADGTIDETITSGAVFPDLLGPTIALDKLKDTYSLGSSVNLKNIATDNKTATENIILSVKLDDTDLFITNNKATLPFIGDHTFAITATDEAGNISTATKLLHINYIFSGVTLSPVSENNTYIKGDVVSISFKLKGKNGVMVPVDHPGIDAVRDSDGYHALLNPDINDENGICDLGENCFKKTTAVYKFKLKTKILDVGEWNIVVKLSDGTTYTIPILIQ